MSLWLRFVLAVLATWRVTHLLAKEDGPFNLLVRLRTRLGGGIFAQLMDCFQCLSLWVAAFIAFWVCSEPLQLLLVWLALSGAACLLERLGQQAVVIEPLPPDTTGDKDYGMLRSEPRETRQPSGIDGNG